MGERLERDTPAGCVARIEKRAREVERDTESNRISNGTKHGVDITECITCRRLTRLRQESRLRSRREGPRI